MVTKLQILKKTTKIKLSVDRYVSQVIDYKDLKFFIPLGAISCVLMELTSFLPEIVNRGLFSNIINDHIPWSSIMLLFVIQALCVFFYHLIPNKKIQSYVNDMVTHFTFRLKMLCSPALSVFIGMAIGCLFFALFDDKYFGYAKVFLFISIFFLLLPIMSISMRDGLKKGINEFFKELLPIFGISLILVMVVMPLFNDSPIDVSFKLSVGQYEIIEKASNLSKIEISDISKSASIERAIEINAIDRN
jgi:hypothetical protein